ncbi:MAG TPA: FMN-binding negative transcriptional regulator [Sediminibacterium sp.]|nr:FMN-binding negative transcriptional regulator [Sediminibacterium sp.]
MYQLPRYQDADAAAVMEFMKSHPFVTLIGVGEDGSPVATQVPILLREEAGTILLRGHIMRQSDHYLAFAKNPAALVLFTGPHAYISASWYEDPAQASTWNYMTVQAKGRLVLLDDHALLPMLQELTDHYEPEGSSPAAFSQLPEEYLIRLSKAIAGFEIRVDSLQHVFKLSQNRDANSFQHILSQLEKGSDDARAIAAEMRKRQAGLFPISGKQAAR